MEIYETRLPGVGTRYEFTAEGGDHVGVVVRRDGKRDIAMYDVHDPDTTIGTLELHERSTDDPRSRAHGRCRAGC